ncbi:MAG: hypothetical protein J0L64_00565 [Acidobacteria bacterium]|nr:hypothetical protein [Acidobacteriota bacterium]
MRLVTWETFMHTSTVVRGVAALLLLSATALAQGTITTIAGTGDGVFTGDGGQATAAALQAPTGLAVDAAGNIYIADFGNKRIRRITPAGVIDTYAGNGTIGFSGDGGPAVNAQLFVITSTHQGLAVDPGGNLYIADPDNARIRKVTPAGTISTYAGMGPALFGGDGGPATMAGLSLPGSVALDGAGNLFLTDQNNSRIRKVTPAGVISTVAGTGLPAYSGDGGPATNAGIAFPVSVATDTAGNLYFADLSSHRIRKVDLAGVVTTVVGNGTPGFGGDGGAATAAQILSPKGMAVDGAGNLYFADTNNDRIRKVDTNGIITTVAGTAQPGFWGDGGPATSARLSSPRDVKVDAQGNLYIADAGNNRIRKVSAVGSGGGGGTGGGGVGGGGGGGAGGGGGTGLPVITRVGNAAGNSTTIAPNTWVEIKGTNLSSTTRVWAGADFSGGQMPIRVDGVSVTVNGRNAFVYYVSPTQINVLTPPDAMQGAVPVVVTAAGGSSSPFTVQAQELSPAFFTFNGGNYLAATHADGSLLGPATLFPGATTPARPGEQVILYGNGFGVTIPPVVSGSASQSGTLPLLPTVSVGGLLATVQFAGLISPGLFQLNITVPANAADGDLMIRAGYLGALTQAQALLSVKK